MKAHRKPTPALVREALAAIPPDLDRDTWARIGMAVKSELASDGFELWNEWSARGESYSAADAKSTWRSIKAAGGTTIGTLFAIAREHGFRFPEASADLQAPAKAQAEDKVAVERRRKREQEEAQYRDRADRAAREAGALWDKASTTGVSPYLERKGVRGHGVRFLSDGTLLVPLRNAAGELQNLQRIAPAKPTGQAPETRFLAGGRKSGLWHLIGEATGNCVILLAEGYATAASLHEACDLPAVVAFDAGNLVHVAKALREQLPDAVLLICGDDDADTAARTGINTGRQKAASAARAAAKAAVGLAGMVLPVGLPTGGSDFNDLARHLGSEAVKAQIEAALTAVRAGSAPLSSTPAEKAEDISQAKRSRDPFTLDELGVWYTQRDDDGNEKRPQWLCAPLKVAARTHSDDANGWGYQLEFQDPNGNAKTWAMPSALLSGEGSEWAGRLRDMGLSMATGTRSRNLVAQYIDTRNPPERVTCTDRVGWHGSVYVLPSGSIFSERQGRRFVYQSDTGMEDTFRWHGGLDQWRGSVARLAEGNSRIVFALCVAFAAPLLRLAGMESGGFHLRGDSSQGKTTALRIAASVNGRPSYMQRWRATSNALESIAVQHCDAALILDELGQLDPREAGDCAYLLANEQEKGRATRSGLPRKRRTWRLLFLSSGEVSLAGHMAEAGKRTRAGMEVRMIDVPLDAGAGMGGIEALHGHDGPAAIAEAIVAGAARNYGTAGRAWIEWLCARTGELQESLPALIDRHRDEMVPHGAAEQVRRAGNRFALVAAAGELATKAGITGWPEGHVAWAVRKCFSSWLAARGHLDNGEDAAMERQVRHFIEANGDARFTWVHRAADDHAPKTMNRAGFKRLLDPDGKPIKSNSDHMREYGERITAADGEQARCEYLILTETFKREVCAGFDSTAVAKLLKKRGHLIGEDDRLTDRQRLPGITGATKVPCYRIKDSIFNDAF